MKEILTKIALWAIRIVIALTIIALIVYAIIIKVGGVENPLLTMAIATTATVLTTCSIVLLGRWLAIREYLGFFFPPVGGAVLIEHGKSGKYTVSVNALNKWAATEDDIKLIEAYESRLNRPPQRIRPLRVGDIIPLEERLARLNGVEQGLFHLRQYMPFGWFNPIFSTIVQYPFSWAELKQPEGGSAEFVIRSREERVRQVKIVPTNYVIQTKAITSDGANVEITMSISVEVINPLIAAIDNTDWFFTLSTELRNYLAEYVANITVEDLIAQTDKKGVKQEAVFKFLRMINLRTSPVFSDTWEKVEREVLSNPALDDGVELRLGVRLVGAAFVVLATPQNKILAARQIAEEKRIIAEADARVITALGDAENAVLLREVGIVRELAPEVAAARYIGKGVSDTGASTVAVGYPANLAIGGTTTGTNAGGNNTPAQPPVSGQPPVVKIKQKKKKPSWLAGN